MEKTINAKIEGTMLGYEDHGILTCMLHLDYGGSGQGFGGYSLGGEVTDAWIRKILEVVGVGTWEELRGQYIRVRVNAGKVVEIGHLLEDKWFNPR